jgi:hypothetical protein
MADVWLAALAVDEISATILGSMQASSDTIELEERLRKQRYLKYAKVVKIYI